MEKEAEPKEEKLPKDYEGAVYEDGSQDPPADKEGKNEGWEEQFWYLIQEWDTAGTYETDGGVDKASAKIKSFIRSLIKEETDKVRGDTVVFMANAKLDGIWDKAKQQAREEVLGELEEELVASKRESYYDKEWILSLIQTKRKAE